MYQPPFGERTDAWKPNGLRSAAIVAPESSIPRPPKVAISGCFRCRAGAMIAVRSSAKRWKRPFGVGSETTTGCSRAARVRSHGVFARTRCSERTSSRNGFTLLPRSFRVGIPGDFATRLRVVRCQNAFVPCTSLSARRLLPAPAGSATVIAVAITNSPTAAAVSRLLRRTGLRSSPDARISFSPPNLNPRPRYRFRSGRQSDQPAGSKSRGQAAGATVRLRERERRFSRRAAAAHPSEAGLRRRRSPAARGRGPRSRRRRRESRQALRLAGVRARV